MVEDETTIPIRWRWAEAEFFDSGQQNFRRFVVSESP